MFSHFQFCIHWKMFLWTWGVCAFSNPRIFIISFPQYGGLFALSIQVIICRLWGCCASPPYSSWSAGEDWNTWPEILDLVNLWWIQSIQTRDSTPFATICSLPGAAELLSAKSLRWVWWLFSVEEAVAKCFQPELTTHRKLKRRETTKCHTQTVPTNSSSSQ